MQSTTKSLRLLFTKGPQVYRESRIFIEIIGPRKPKPKRRERYWQEEGKEIKIVKIMQRHQYLDIHHNNDKKTECTVRETMIA
jgi:hypothetical protein